jgi:hypothetical protein
MPEVTSERREYIPIGFMTPDHMASNLVSIIPGATCYHFGILSPKMHMAWVRYVCGRLEGRYRYSNLLVYNNYPWPTATDKHTQLISEKAQAVLDTRAQFPNSTLADLYDPNSMPVGLRKAHDALDRAVDNAYRRMVFRSDKERVEFLFELYQKLTQPLIARSPKKRSRKRQMAAT